MFRLVALVVFASIFETDVSSLPDRMEHHPMWRRVLDIVPDVVHKYPKDDNLKVTYSGGVKVFRGNTLTPSQTQTTPSVHYQAASSDFFLLCMTDPDVPSRDSPTMAEFKHWLVGNIPGNDISSGEALAEYFGPAPPQGTGYHRYVFLLFKQKGRIDFDEPYLAAGPPIECRFNFSIQKFANKYKLGVAVNANAFRAQFEE